jgi:hypothetical protein
VQLGRHAGVDGFVDGADYNDQVTRPVCVELNVLAAGQPPSTIGSR